MAVGADVRPHAAGSAERLAPAPRLDVRALPDTRCGRSAEVWQRWRAGPPDHVGRNGRCELTLHRWRSISVSHYIDAHKPADDTETSPPRCEFRSAIRQEREPLHRCCRPWRSTFSEVARSWLVQGVSHSQPAVSISRPLPQFQPPRRHTLTRARRGTPAPTPPRARNTRSACRCQLVAFDHLQDASDPRPS